MDIMFFISAAVGFILIVSGALICVSPLSEILIVSGGSVFLGIIFFVSELLLFEAEREGSVGDGEKDQ